LRAEDEVAVGVLVDPLDGLAGVLGQDLLDPPALPHDLLRVDLEVDRLPLDPAVGLVQQHARVRQGVALAARAGGQDHRGGRGGLPQAVRGHVGLEELHRVVDREQGRGGPARAVHVQGDVLARLDRVEEQQLRHDRVGERVVDRLAEEHDALAEQARVDVEGPFAARGLLDDGGDEGSGHSLSSSGDR
jgi:hypothetical protein